MSPGAAWPAESTEAGGPCSRRYLAPGRQCPNDPAFTVRLATESRPRKARMACAEHLADVIWAMQRDHGDYDGYYTVTAAPPDSP